MKYDYTDLRQLILEKFGTCKAFGQKTGYSQVNVSHRLMGHIGLSQNDIVKWSKALGIDKSEYGRYFFTLKL